jgi:hypothetical protein
MKHAPARGLTVRAYATEWLVKRQERDLDWRDDESRFRKHILAEIGDMPLAEVRARHLVDLFHKLRTDKERDLGHRTVHSVYRAVSAMFRDARLADLVEQSPCMLGERQLGPIRDKDPAWRGEAVFTHDEASTLISDARIPFDRQIVYAIELLAGVRPGAAAALRFRYWDPRATSGQIRCGPLPSLQALNIRPIIPTALGERSRTRGAPQRAGAKRRSPRGSPVVEAR